MTEWDALPEAQQLQLAAAALREASRNVAEYADALAAEMAAGAVPDRGGEDALRLLAELVRNVTSASDHGLPRA